jgi:xylose isomerase
MKMAVEYGRSIGFEGDFYIEPKPKEPMKHQYDFDAATAIGFLRKYGLDKDFKMNIEANHATLAGHTFQHELRVSAINGMLGSIDANQGDLLLGWDTDEFPFNVYESTMCMYEVLKAGGLTGGFNFDSKTRRPSNTVEDMFYSYILGMDTFALGLIKAAEIIEDGRIDNFIKERYSSFTSGIGEKILSGEATLQSLFAEAEKMGAPTLVSSGRQEYLQSIVNEILFK